MEYVIGIVIGVVLGGAACYGLLALTGRNLVQSAKRESENILTNGRKQAENLAKEIELSARQEQLRIREAFEKESEGSRRRLEETEARLTKREDTLDRKLDTLTVKERNLDDLEKRVAAREKSVAAKDEKLSATLKEQQDRLLNITSLTREQATDLLLRRLEDELKSECGAMIQRMTDQAMDEAKEKSRQIILQAIQRYAAEQTAEQTVATVTIPSDDMKGRVIGREGRNIRAFEKITGVDVIIDDTPGVVVVSCFDPVRREIARLSLDRLVQDGRIHPARIEEVHATTTKEIEEDILRIGKEAIQEANLGNLPKPIVPMLGRLHFRTSYGQNVLKHSLEVAYLCQVIANELGLDGNIARRAGLLHDIGKAMDHDMEGGHPLIGMEFLKRYNEKEEVLNAAWAHHGDVPSTTP
jgi:ribonuclease Y